MDRPLSSIPPLFPYPHSQHILPDLMWSDPDEVYSWAVSPRGAGWLFGASITKEVCPVRPIFFAY